MIAFRDELKAVAIPAAVLVVAGVAASISQQFSTTLGNFGIFGPYAVLIIGTAIALWFNRGRAFIALISLLVAFIAYRISFGFGPDDFPVRAVLTTAAIFVPANVIDVLAVQRCHAHATGISAVNAELTAQTHHLVFVQA